MTKGQQSEKGAKALKTPKKNIEAQKPMKSLKNDVEKLVKYKDSTKHVTPTNEWSESDDEEDATSETENLQSIIKSLPTTSCIKNMFREFSDSIKEEISTLRSDIRQISSRMTQVEDSTEQLSAHASFLAKRMREQKMETYALKLHLDDLENRSRRNNLRIKGLTESVTDAEIIPVLTKIFCELLDKDDTFDLGFQRAHRVYRPKNSNVETPRDVLCCLLDFSIKEEIFKKARSAKKIEYDDKEVLIFQDISRYTLELRRNLQPLTSALRSKGLKYRWLFPFGLFINCTGRPIIVREPADIQKVTQKLDLHQIAIKDWIAGEEEDSEPQLPRYQPWEFVSTPKTKKSRTVDAESIMRAPQKPQRTPAGD